MKSIRIKNLRCLKDTGNIELKPITMLVGANSSGKSTFLRTFPLFKQGNSVYKQGPILWYGSEVDFGSYSEAICRGEKYMEFSFAWDSIYIAPFFLSPSRYLHNVSCTIKVEQKDEDESYISNIDIKFEDNQKIKIEISNEKTIITINDIEATTLANVSFSRRVGKFILPYIVINSKNDESSLFMSIPTQYILKTLGMISWFKNKIPKEKNAFTFSPTISTKVEMLKETCEHYKVLYNETILEDKFWQQYNAVIILYSLNELISSIDRELQQELGEVYYIKPFRASAERYYRQQNLAVRNLDSDGHNMAMFVANMYKNRSMKQEFQEWTRKYFKFEIEPKRIEGHLSIAIKDKLASKKEEAKEDEYRNIADKGFGYSQILPVILTLWQISSRKQSKQDFKYSCIAAYEQPELHLHPKMQAELMDAIIATVKASKNKGMDVKFLVETHSPIMINRLGLHVALDPGFSSDMTSVLLFDEDDAESPKRAEYDDKGRLVNWPIGFFEPDLYVY